MGDDLPRFRLAKAKNIEINNINRQLFVIHQQLKNINEFDFMGLDLKILKAVEFLLSGKGCRVIKR